MSTDLRRFEGRTKYGLRASDSIALLNEAKRLKEQVLELREALEELLQDAKEQCADNGIPELASYNKARAAITKAQP